MELHNTLEGHKVSSDEKEKQSELQGLLCGCLQVIIQKLGSSESSEYFDTGLQNFEEYQVCAVTVGVVGDICRALEAKIVPYCDGIMTQLLKNLSSNQLHRSVKAPIFSCFGDIALAVGEYFEKYLMWAMSALQSAAELSNHTAGDDEWIEYINTLRNGILEAYSGIFQGFKNSPKAFDSLCTSHPPVLRWHIHGERHVSSSKRDDVVMKTAFGVLGDLADTLGSHAASLIQQSVSSKDF
ncbi:Importin subunit beta-1 [Hibiscus syriacus]|uniref:Importin subunit beta-1 n=1 Tax=Hibiscus syriacus TaxID=106335 RepID=A0A6A3CDZ4_HIBSY|nr:Importin subunit beta-1 [Hibiscus syriacus]